MIYSVYADQYLLYPDENATNVKLDLALNQAGQLSFVLFDTHPNFIRPAKLSSLIKVYRDADLIWTGRVINSEQYFDNSMSFIAEGRQAFFNDSIVRPYTFTGTVTDLLDQLLTEHNAQTGKPVLLGTVDFTDEVTRTSDIYQKTWQILKSSLLDTLGGYFSIRYDGTDVYLDYLSEMTASSSQIIEYGENLLDLQNAIDATKTFTAVLPIGAEVVIQAETEEEPEIRERLTIKAVNEGADFITNPTAVALYGTIFADPSLSTFDDITMDTHLLAKGQELLATGIMLKQSIQLSAVDLAYIDSVDSFQLGDNITVTSTPHGISGSYVLEELGIDISFPENTTITIGKEKNTLVDVILGDKERATRAENYVEKVIKDYVINGQVAQVYQEIEEARTAIIQTATLIVMEAMASYVTTSQLETYKTQVSTRFEQTETAFGFEFTTKTVQEVINDVTGAISGSLNELKSYVRIEGGVIKLGKSDSIFTLEIDNDSVTFFVNGVSAGTFTPDNFQINVGKFTTSAQVGAFGFVPRTDGNLTLKKISG